MGTPVRALWQSGNLTITFSHSANTLANAPQGFFDGLDIVRRIITATFKAASQTDLHIQVDWGEINGQPMGGAAGSSSSTYVPVNYTNWRNFILSINAAGSSTIPSVSPIAGTMQTPISHSKAMGFSANDGLNDGFVGISSSISWVFDNSVPTGGQGYFIGTALHEVTEVMGRVSLLDFEPSFYSPTDLFRYTGSGVRDTATGGTGYFSVDGGVTNLRSWNDNPASGDLGDWVGAGGPDMGDNSITFGVKLPMSSYDILEMNAIGYKLR